MQSGLQDVLPVTLKSFQQKPRQPAEAVSKSAAGLRGPCGTGGPR